MDRRDFLGTAAGVVGLGRGSRAVPTRIIDTHIHLFDPTRRQGVPWPAKDDALLYRRALPSRYRGVTKGLGIVGAIAVECSPWLVDNQWVLDVAAKDTIIVGTVGDLEPGKSGFRGYLEQFHQNPLFRGIRYGNLWGRNLGEQLSRPQFISDLRALADAGLELDTANPDPALISEVVRLTDKVPTLRVVIDHMPQLSPPAEWRPTGALLAKLRELGKRPQVYVKISEVLRRVDDHVPTDLEFYRPRLDQLWDIFGPDRLVYGSDWPNNQHWGSYSTVLSVVREYFTDKGPMAAERFFWKNSVAAYRWVRRETGQPQLATSETRDQASRRERDLWDGRANQTT